MIIHYTIINRATRFGLLLFCITLFALGAFAQSEGTMYTMIGVPQSTNYNPAFVPKYKFILSLGAPSIHAHYSNSSFKYSDFAVKQGDSTVVDLNKLNSALREKNYVTTAADVEMFRLGIKINPRLYFSTYVTGKAYSRAMLPKDLTGLFIEGTSAYVNSSASFSPEIDALAYVETAMGFSYVVSTKLTAGARVKYLTGLANVTTESSQLNLAVSEDYALTATANVNAKTSGIQNRDNAEYKDYLKNSGYGLDVGATYKLTSKLTVAASILDIGAIKWRNDTYGYTLDPAEASYTFVGVDLQKVLDGDEDYLDAEGDSIKSKFELQEGAIDSYHTRLPGKMYLSANYDWKRKVSFGGVLVLEKFQGRFNPSLTGYAHKELGKIAGASISLTASNRTVTNIGLGFNLNLTPFQFYIAGDNLLRMPVSYLVNGEWDEFAANTQFANVRLGLNFIFARDKSEEKKTYNKRSNKKR